MQNLILKRPTLSNETMFRNMLNVPAGWLALRVVIWARIYQKSRKQ